ncbi:MAG: hypothetical protein IVW51_11330 [Thermaceae bacterium]|nr:hypothetical protein [Thermaceae bacterium]
MRKGLGGYTIADFTTPKDWKVSLANVNARRDVVDISGGYTYFQDAAEVILQVDVPALSTDDGLVRATLRLPNGDTINIGCFATLEVPKPGTAALSASSD